MKEVERLLKQIIKKSGDKEAKYFYGVEHSQDAGPDYRARIVPSKAGVEPLLAGANTEEGLVGQLKAYLNGTDIKDIVIQYCEGQIELANKSIKFHEGLIRDYENLHSKV